MSQLTGDMDIDIAAGMTICFVGEIVATLQNRHKVIYEIFDKVSRRPIFRIYLDNIDCLRVSIFETDGSEHSSVPVSPNRFAAYYINRARPNEAERACTYVIRIAPSGAPGETSVTSLSVEVFINNTLESQSTLSGNLPDHTANQMQSIGAAASGELPATFTLGELYMTKSPMSDEDMSASAGYMKTKWDVGHDIHYHRTTVENTSKGAALIVEDKYDQIYKVAWLVLNNISFDAEYVAEAFNSASDFDIIGMHGAGGVAGFLRSKNPAIYQGNRYVGLFDFDREGRENFQHLSKEQFWPKDTLGTKESGIHKVRIDYDRCFAMLLPIPARLADLADLSYSHFLSYVEVENLLPERFLLDNSFCHRLNTIGTSYLKVNDAYKSSLWREACALPKESFLDFAPIFQTAHSLMFE